MKRGRSVQIPIALARQILLQHVAEVEGEDILDLLNNADVDFLDAVDCNVDFSAVAITWHKGE